MNDLLMASAAPTSFAHVWSRDKYRLASAARPFSLVVGVMSSALGLVLGWSQADAPLLPAILTLLACLLLQVGVNLINDFSDRDLVSERFGHLDPAEQAAISQRIHANFRLGLLAVASGVLLGLWLVYLSGPLLLLIGLLGVLGVFAYAQPPIDFKRRGLGMLSVFLLMGLLTVQGAYYVMTGALSLEVLWLSLPWSLLVILMLLSNELRDFELDQHEGQRTFTVRVGDQLARRLYLGLLLPVFLLPLVFVAQGHTPGWLLTLAALLLVPGPLRHLRAAPRERKRLPPLTGRLLAGFGLLQLLGLLYPV